MRLPHSNGLAGFRALSASEGSSADIHKHSGSRDCFASFWSLVLSPGNAFLVPKVNDLAFGGLVIEDDFVHRFVGLIGNGSATTISSSRTVKP